MKKIFILTIALISCDDDGPSRRTQPGEQMAGAGQQQGDDLPELASRSFSVTDTEFCTLDLECDRGHYCFLGRCAYQCQTDDECLTGSCDDRAYHVGVG